MHFCGIKLEDIISDALRMLYMYAGTSVFHRVCILSPHRRFLWGVPNEHDAMKHRVS
jgi:hypothetical protein